MLTVESFFDLSDFPYSELFKKNSFAWEALNELKSYMDNYTYPQYDLIQDGIPLTNHIIIHKGKNLSTENTHIEYGDTTKGKLTVNKNGETLDGASVVMAGATLIGDRIDVGSGVLIESGAMVKSPTILGDRCEVRQGAYVRGYCLAGKRCILGHTTEIKHSIFLNDAKAGHFAYLGDSILGNNANLGAGTKFANLKFLPGNVFISHQGEKIDTGRRKFGAILGDNCQTGCNSVTSPGTLMSQGAMLLPNTTARGGYHARKRIIR